MNLIQQPTDTSLVAKVMLRGSPSNETSRKVVQREEYRLGSILREMLKLALQTKSFIMCLWSRIHCKGKPRFQLRTFRATFTTTLRLGKLPHGACKSCHKGCRVIIFSAFTASGTSSPWPWKFHSPLETVMDKARARAGEQHISLSSIPSRRRRSDRQIHTCTARNPAERQSWCKNECEVHFEDEEEGPYSLVKGCGKGLVARGGVATAGTRYDAIP